MDEIKTEALETVETEPSNSEPVEETKKESKKKRKYGEVMTAGSFIRTFILLLIPGINILCIIFWAIGAARNKNKVNLSRGLIAFFFIEILLALIVFGVGYIIADQKKDAVFKWANAKTDGVFEYMEIDEYKELPKLLGISKYLMTKSEPSDDNSEEPVVVIPKTSYVYNPEGIASSDEFFKLFKEQFATEETAEETTTEAQTDEATTKDAKDLPKTLFEILEANNVDVENSERIYVIFESEKENCVIIFNKDGVFEIDSYPSFIAGKDFIMVGGAK